MSELNNPLFDNEREFLERQKEEYRRALAGDMDQIKAQGQEIGKKVAIAGGVLLAGLLLKRMLFGSSKKKEKKLSKGKAGKKGKGEPHGTFVAAAYPTYPIHTSTPMIDYEAHTHAPSSDYTLPSEQQNYTYPEAQPVKKKPDSFLNSRMSKALQQQAMALLVMYATKKLEEYLNSVSENKNNDIAAKPAVVEPTVMASVTETPAYTVPEKDAI